MAALKKAGIAARDIQTSNLSLNAQYAYEQNQPPKLTGYQASNRVTITVRDLAKLGAAVDATVSAGANTVNGISFGLANPQAAEDAARLAAVKALQAKAELYGRATGYKAVRLVNLSEGGGYTPAPPPMPVFAMAKREMADATSISAGELKVRVDVSAVYEESASNPGDGTEKGRRPGCPGGGLFVGLEPGLLEGLLDAVLDLQARESALALHHRHIGQVARRLARGRSAPGRSPSPPCCRGPSRCRS